MSKFFGPLIFCFLIFFSFPSFSSPLEKGAMCPPGATFDGKYCFIGRPHALSVSVVNNRFTHSGQPCQLGTTFDGTGCSKPVPWNYEPLIHLNGWYVKPLPHFVGVNMDCPTGLKHDGSNCFFKKAPAGREASVRWGHFIFKRKLGENCSRIMQGAWGMIDLTACAVLKVPKDHEAFIYDNGWYTKPTPGGDIKWFSKVTRNVSNDYLNLVCINLPKRDWELIWSEEFDEIPDNQKCYTSAAEEIKCVYKAWWGHEPCRDRPLNWTVKGSMNWDQNQLQKYIGLRNLNKCRWQVFDSFNNWDQQQVNRSNSFRPDNMTVRNGVLKMTTRTHNGNYDCGRGTLPNPSQTGQEWTRNCPYSGATIHTNTGLPWTSGNSPSATNPSNRYIGYSSGFGRFEFRVKVNKLGHGGWPSVWLFYDNSPGEKQPMIEIDNLEMIADLNGQQSLGENVTYGMAHQTLHNWGGNGSGMDHRVVATSLPISVGEWHVFSSEWDDKEVRFYIDDCLRKVIKDGEKILIDGKEVTFRVPGKQNVHIIIGNPSSGSDWLPAWYRARLINGKPISDFKTTELEVDWVRVYKLKN